jgi:hypothetical protein
MLDRPSILCALVIVVGCGNTAIEGTLVDVQGNGIDGAMVTAVGTQCSAVTDQKGAYDLTCAAGTHKLVMSKQGYLTEELMVEAPERKRYSGGNTILVKIPEDKGLFIFSKSAYQAMQRGRLTRQLSGKGMKKKRAYCLDKDTSQPNAIAPGVVPFFDNDAPGWRPFRLDAQGCAYRDARNERGSWVVEYREKPNLEEQKLSDTMKLSRLQLTPGDYFIADWRGFFVANAEDPLAYGGYWVTVAR